MLEMFQAGGCITEVAHTNLAWGGVLRDRGDAPGAAERLESAAEQFTSSRLAKQAAEAEALLREVKKAVRA